MVEHLTFNHGVGRSNRLRETIYKNCPGGEIGRRKGLKIPRGAISVPVQVRPSAPKSTRKSVFFCAKIYVKKEQAQFDYFLLIMIFINYYYYYQLFDKLKNKIIQYY